MNHIPGDETTSTPRFLRIQVVMDRVGLGRSTIYTKIELGKFPKQVVIGDRAVGWLETEINEWISKRVLARSACTARERSHLLTHRRL